MRIGRKLWAALLPLLLSGCMMSASAESLYALPQLPEEYKALSVRLAELLSSGAEYAPPQTGQNLPPVQMVDLDGDGSDEALVFLRQSSEERPLKIYIYQEEGDGYELAGRIDGSGTSIHSILYQDLNGDGVQELIVSWSVGAEVQSLAVYALEDMQNVQLMNTPYARYEVVDLDGDDDKELVVLRSGGAEAGVCLADYYDWSGSGFQLQSTARLSVPVAALQWMQVGALQSGETAVFVTSQVSGAGEQQVVTDILVWREASLENVVLNSDTGVSNQIARVSNLNLQPTDIDGDGATEVPEPVELLSESGAEPYWKIYWYGYSADGAESVRALTYHNLKDSWYLIIPEKWDGHFTVQQNNASSSIHATTFYAADRWTVGEELLTIYTFSGTDRETQAAKGGRTILRRRTAPDRVYAIAYSEGYDQWRYAVPREILEKTNFQPIIKQWSMGEN